MNKHLLSFFVLIAFALLALFPASIISITASSIMPTTPKIHGTLFFKTLVYTPKHTDRFPLLVAVNKTGALITR